MKKRIFIITLCLLGMIATGMIVLGFTVQTTAYISDDFSVSEDGSELTFKVNVPSSMGFIRGYKDEGGGIKPHYLKFYSTWGGFNSPLGAKNEFTLKLDAEDTEIYVYRGNGGYYLALKKNEETGKWYRVQ